MPAGIDGHLRIFHRALVLQRIGLEDIAYRRCLVVTLQRKPVLPGNEQRSLHGVAHLRHDFIFRLCRIRLQLRYDLERPRPFHLFKVDDHLRLIRVDRVRYDRQFVPDFRRTVHLAVALGRNDVELYRVSPLVRQEDNHRIGASVARQTVSGTVAFQLRLHVNSALVARRSLIVTGRKEQQEQTYKGKRQFLHAFTFRLQIYIKTVIYKSVG